MTGSINKYPEYPELKHMYIISHDMNVHITSHESHPTAVRTYEYEWSYQESEPTASRKPKIVDVTLVKGARSLSIQALTRAVTT